MLSNEPSQSPKLGSLKLVGWWEACQELLLAKLLGFGSSNVVLLWADWPKLIKWLFLLGERSFFALTPAWLPKRRAVLANCTGSCLEERRPLFNLSGSDLPLLPVPAQSVCNKMIVGLEKGTAFPSRGLEETGRAKCPTENAGINQPSDFLLQHYLLGFHIGSETMDWD